MSLEADVENCKERVAYSAKAAQKGERMRLWINGIPLLGAPVVAGLAWLHPLLGSVAVASLTLAWLLGVYRTELLCQATVGRLQDAEQELTQAQQHLALGANHLADRDDLTPIAWSTAAARARPSLSPHTPAYRH